jgi:hypothetical protein
VFKRAFTVANGGTYRFWLTANEGAALYLTDVSTGIRTALTPSTTLPYPFKSASATPFTYHGTANYFYQQSIPAGVHILEINYFKKDATNGADGYLRLRSASDRSATGGGSYGPNYVLRNTATTYPLGQRTAVYFGTSGSVAAGAISPVSGGWNVPAGTNVRVVFSGRWVIGGGSSSTPDGFAVYYSKNGAGGDGTVWVPATIKRRARSGADFLVDGSGNPVYEDSGTVSFFDYNKDDEFTPVDVNETFQNWDTYTIDIPSNAFAYVLNLKFETDSRSNFIPGTTAEGWYIDNVQLITQ